MTCVALVVWDPFPVLLLLLVFTHHPLRVEISPPPLHIDPHRPKLSYKLQELRLWTEAHEAAGPWGSSLLSHKITNICTWFHRPTFFHICTSLDSYNHPVCRKDKSYCFHFKEEDAEVACTTHFQGSSTEQPRKPIPTIWAPTSCLCDFRPFTQTLKISVSFLENGDNKNTCLLEWLHRWKEIIHVECLAHTWLNFSGCQLLLFFPF